MRGVIYFFLAAMLIACAPDSDTEGSVYNGKANLNIRLHQFVAVNSKNNNDIIITMTAPRELTVDFNDRISHIDYEDDIIIFKSETEPVEWTAKKVKNGFKREDGTLLQKGNCKDWSICLIDSVNKIPILKGKYSLSGSSAKITLWISPSEEHVELLALMANALLNKSKNAKQSIESSLGTLSSQVWLY